MIDANRRLDERRRFSEAVLYGVSAGVLALDKEQRITLSNPSATLILGTLMQGMKVADALPGIEPLLAQAEQRPERRGGRHPHLNANDKMLSLHVRITAEHTGIVIEGFIVTFDDISPLISAQRNAAWADVARRVAHEIKNPLTPIQLPPSG